MTTIYINDSGEPRYMPYVPEKSGEYLTMLEAMVYRKALEKAKSESLPFEDKEWAKTVIQSELIKINGYSAAQFKPGLYQVPVEVEVAGNYIQLGTKGINRIDSE